jgi:antitoxin VapB
MYESKMHTILSRVFNNGNSQAVRIPAEFRLNTQRVTVSKNAQGDLVIHALDNQRGQALLAALQDFDADFIEQLEANQQEYLPLQEREDL